MHALLFLIKELSFSDIIDDDELALLAVKKHWVRGHLNIDRLLVSGLMSPGTGDDRLSFTRRILNQQGWNVFAGTNIINGHRKKLFSRISIYPGRGFIYGQKSMGFFIVNPNWLGSRLEE